MGPHAAPFRQASSRAALLAGARSALQMRWGIRKVGGPTAGELAEMRRRAFAIGGGASGARCNERRRMRALRRLMGCSVSGHAAQVVVVTCRECRVGMEVRGIASRASWQSNTRAAKIGANR